VVKQIGSAKLLKEERMKRLLLFGGMLMALVMMGSPAFATVVIDFEQGYIQGGTVQLVGSDWVGTDIPMEVLKVDINGATSLYDLQGFGPASTLVNPLTDSSALLSFTFNPASKTGTIQIAGSVPALGVGQQTLLNGVITDGLVKLEADTFSLANAVGSDTKAREMLDALGLAPNLQWNFISFTLAARAGVGAAYTAYSVDVMNTVPLPPSMFLLAPGLLGIVGLRKRFAK